MDATSRPSDGPQRGDSSGPEGGRPGGAERGETDRAYAEHKRLFIAAGGTADRFEGLKLLQAARLSANRAWAILARVRGEAETPASERDVRRSLDGFATEAEAARSKGRLRAFTRRLWPFGLPWH